MADDAQLEELLAQCESQVEQLSERDDEIAELRERNAQLEEELLGSGKGGDLELRDELREHRARLETAEDQLEKAMDRAKEQESRARDADLQNKALQMEKLKLEAELQKEQERADNGAEELAALRQRSEQALESEGRSGARERTNKKTLIKALGENEDLRKEVADLEGVVQTLYQAVNDKDAAVGQAQANMKTAELERSDAESEVVELKRLLREKEGEIAARNEELNAVSELESEIKESVSLKIEKWKQKVREGEKQVEEERKQRVALQKKCDSLLMESGLREIEQQLVASQEAAKATQRELFSTKQQLDDSRAEILEVARENEALKTDQGKFIDLALEKEKAELERLKAVVASRDVLIDEERARYKELYEEKGDLEEELQDREFTLAEYERGHGLTEAVLKQKKLKGDIKRRDKEIRRLNQALSERIGAHERLFETCRRLKSKAGLPESFEFDQLELEQGMKGQSERLQGLIRELEGQNEALESDRLRLLEALRKNALNVGDKGMKFYGLSAEQVILVNEFADNLKDGRTDLPLNDKSLELLNETKELKRRIKELERDVAAAELAIERGGGGGGGGGSSSSPSILNLDVDKSSHNSNPEFDRQLERMAQEQMMMVSEIKLELQKLVKQQQHPNSAAAASNASNASQATGGYDKLMDMLESKLQGGGTSSGADQGQVEALRDELERQSLINDQLTKRLEQAGARSFPQSPSSQRQQGFSKSPREQQQQQQQGLWDAGDKTGLGGLGQKFHNAQAASLRLPPEEWADQYLVLQKQLALCIEQVVSREKEVARTERSLVAYELKAEALAAQVGALYREHADARVAWDEEKGALRKDADEARNERDALRAKARRLDTLCAVLESEDESAPRDHVKELTRKIAVLEVNEVVLARKYNLIAAEERVLRHESELQATQAAQTESALRERVVYLEEWKAGSQAYLASVMGKLAKSVPRETHEQSIRKLASVRHNYRELLAREAALRSRSSGANALRRRVHELEVELDVAKADLAHHKRKGKPEEPALLQDEQRPDVGELARLKGESVEREILLESTVKRAEIFERRATELAAELGQETERADSGEAAADSAREIVSKLEAEIVELRDNYAGGATAAERKVLDERIEELEGLYESLRRENTRFRELADIASSQVQAFDASNQAKVKELEEVRAQLRQVNARSDDDAIIGKVQHELTTTKVSYQMFVRKFELAKASIRRGELERIQLESQLDQKDRMIMVTREEARARIMSLQGALEELDVLQPLVDSSPNSNSSSNKENQQQENRAYRPKQVPHISGMERLSETIARLGESAEHSEEALRRSELARRNLEGQIERQNAELESTRALVADLRQRVFANDSGDFKDTVAEQRGLAKRLLDLNEELKSSRVECLRQKRDLEIIREEKLYLEKLREKDEEHMARLEESVANTENALRRREDEKTFRLAADPTAKDGFGLPLLAVRPIASSTFGASAGGSRPDGQEGRASSLVDQEESAEQNKAALMELMELRSTLRQAQVREEQLGRKVATFRSKIAFLKRRLGAEGLDDQDDDADWSEENVSSENRQVKSSKAMVPSYYEADARKLQAAAKQTIASLKETVSRKNAAIEGMRKKLENLRSSSLAERQRDQIEIQRLTEKLYEDNKEEISKLRSAYENIYTSQGGSGGKPGTDVQAVETTVHRDMLERLEEADVMLDRKDRRILELEQAAEELSILRQRAEDKAAKSAQVAQRLGEKVRLITMGGTGPEQLIKQLRGQLLAKDKKLHGLRAAVVALKNEFVKSEEEHEGELVLKDREIAQINQNQQPASAAESGGPSKRQLQALKERVERMREDLEDQRHREEKLKQDNQRLERQLEEQLDSQASREEATTSAGKRLGSLERQIDDLKRENRRLHETLANSSAAGLGAAATPHEEKTDDGRSSQSSSREAELRRKLQVAQAQNAAFRSSSRTAAGRDSLSTSSSKTDKWQADKRLERQVKVLTRKLDDTRRELDAEQGKAAQAKALYERISRENQQLKHNFSKKEEHQLLQQRDQQEQQHHKAFNQNNSELLRETQVEQRAEINRLTRQVRASRERALELEEEAERLRTRLRDRKDGRDSLQLAEDDFAIQDELRDQLAMSRKECRALEAQVLDRDNTVLELRFELEQAEARTEKQQLQPFAPSNPSRRQPGERFKRERDLENVVESMKKVVTKLQADNAKLRRGAEGGARAASLAKQLAAAKADKDELDKANALLNRRLQDRGETAAAKIRLQDALRSTKRQLKEAREALAEKEAKLEAVKARLEDAEAFRDNARYSQDENTATLRSRLGEQQELIQRLRQDTFTSNSGADAAEINRLRTENERLLGELNAFDLDFFEEIEDLKYAYARAKEELARLGATAPAPAPRRT